MDLSFFETMRGHLQAGDGRRHSIDFQVKAEASGLRHFLETGQARLTGVLHAPPWAELAPMDGEIAIAPPQRRRVIAYRCLFRNESAEEFLLVGEKKLRLLHPIDSLTRLPVRLMRAGEQVAQGELRFDLRDLPAFVASVWPSSGISRVEMHRPIGREPGTKLLSRSEHAVLEALVESMIAAGARVPAPNAESLAGALMQLADTPAFVVRFYRMSLRWLDATAKIKRKRRFAALTREERVSLLEELCGTAGKPSRRRQSRAVLQFLGVPIKSAHFDRDDYLAAIRHPEAAAPRATSPLSVVREPEPKIFERVVSAEQLESESVIEAEIAIVGTGAGGAPLAAALAQKGHAVVLL
ncbi:MAG: gluconate 2-dehydrogenase subunit 3 family protein, partial [Deltaproteobacteria bacterium]|nr:gluconate 2-dehydrogenase subunit 3 family protein [Deltaproteobacteria bacterium]